MGLKNGFRASLVVQDFFYQQYCRPVSSLISFGCFVSKLCFNGVPLLVNENNLDPTQLAQRGIPLVKLLCEVSSLNAWLVKTVDYDVLRCSKCGAWQGILMSNGNF